MAVHGDLIPSGAGVLVLSTGIVPPRQSSPAAFVAERCRARALALVALQGEPAEPGAGATVASADGGFARQISDVLTAIGMDVTMVRDVAGLERQLTAEALGAQAA
jgi:hypothetical protein